MGFWVWLLAIFDVVVDEAGLGVGFLGGRGWACCLGVEALIFAGLSAFVLDGFYGSEFGLGVVALKLRDLASLEG